MKPETNSKVVMIVLLVAFALALILLVVSVIPRASITSVGPIDGPHTPDDNDDDREHGWEQMRMSDRAKDCTKPGLGRPWCPAVWVSVLVGLSY